MAVVTPPSAELVLELRKKFNQKLEKDGTKVQGKPVHIFNISKSNFDAFEHLPISIII